MEIKQAFAVKKWEFDCDGVRIGDSIVKIFTEEQEAKDFCEDYKNSVEFSDSDCAYEQDAKMAIKMAYVENLCK